MVLLCEMTWSRFGNWIIKLPGNLKPQFDGFVRIFDCLDRCFSVCQTSWQIRNSRNVNFVGLVPVCSNFVVMGHSKINSIRLVAGHDSLQQSVAFGADVSNAGRRLFGNKCRRHNERIDLQRHSFYIKSVLYYL